MKTSEMIENARDSLIAEMKKADRLAYLYTSCEYRVYIDSEGETGSEEWPAGDHAYNQFRDPSYWRCYVGTLCHQFTSILWEEWFDSSADFANAFRDRFGVDLIMDDDRTLEEDAAATAAEAGISDGDLNAWIDELTEEAIAWAISETEACGTYTEMLDEAIRNCEYDED